MRSDKSPAFSCPILLLTNLSVPSRQLYPALKPKYSDSFDELGEYTLRGIASDGSLFTYQNINVTVTR
jgi:hypothetical protein